MRFNPDRAAQAVSLHVVTWEKAPQSLFQSRPGRPGRFAKMQKQHQKLSYFVSIPTGPPRPFRCYARRIAWQAKKSNTFRASLFLGTPRRKQCGHNLSFFLVHVASRVLRESLLRHAITATLGALLSLHDKQHRIG